MQALWMIVATLFFATMAVCVRYASAGFSTWEIVFYRGVLSVALLWMLAQRRGVRLTTAYPRRHAWRAFLSVGSLTSWFYALAHLPLATVLSLNYMSSVWVAAFIVGSALVAFRSRPGLARAQAPLAITVLVGFAGVLIMLRPTIEQDQIVPALVALLSGVLAALVYMQVSALSRLGEPEMRTVFYVSVGSVVGGAAGMLLAGTSPWVWGHAVWLVPVAVLATLGQLCMTLAFSRGATLLVANLQYAGLIFGAIYGMALFDERLPLLGWAGMALIVASGIAATVLRSRTRVAG